MQDFCQVTTERRGVDQSSDPGRTAPATRGELLEPTKSVHAQRTGVDLEDVFDCEAAPELAQLADCLDE